MDAEKKSMEIQQRYKKLQKKYLLLEDQAKELEQLRAKFAQQEALMLQMQALIRPGPALSGITWPGTQLAPFRHEPVSRDSNDLRGRLDRVESLLKVGFKD